MPGEWCRASLPLGPCAMRTPSGLAPTGSPWSRRWASMISMGLPCRCVPLSIADGVSRGAAALGSGQRLQVSRRGRARRHRERKPPSYGSATRRATRRACLRDRIQTASAPSMEQNARLVAWQSAALAAGRIRAANSRGDRAAVASSRHLARWRGRPKASTAKPTLKTFVSVRTTRTRASTVASSEEPSTPTP